MVCYEMFCFGPKDMGCLLPCPPKKLFVLDIRDQSQPTMYGYYPYR